MVDDSANSTGVDEEKLGLAAGGTEVPWSAEEEGTLSGWLPYASGGISTSSAMSVFPLPGGSLAREADVLVAVRGAVEVALEVVRAAVA